MATINAQAKLYQGTLASVVDVILNPSNFTSTSELTCTVLRKRSGIAVVSADATASATPRLSTIGFIAKGMAVESTLRCKFPTYIRIDVDALELPEGTDVSFQLEEGFAIEGNFKESQHSPLPRNDNLFTFRTPKKLYGQLISSLATLHFNGGYRKRTNAYIEALASVTARITYNPGKFTAMEMSNFTVIPNAIKNVKTGAVFNSNFTMPNLGPFKVRLFQSNFVQDTFTLTHQGQDVRVRFGQSPMTTSTVQQTEGTKFFGLVDNFTAQFTTQQTAKRTANAVINISSAMGSSLTAKITRNGSIDMYSTTALTVPSIANYPYVYSHSFTPTNIINSGNLSFSSDGNYIVLSGINGGYSNINDPGSIYVYNDTGTLVAQASNTSMFKSDINNNKIVSSPAPYPNYDRIEVFNTNLVSQNVYYPVYGSSWDSTLNDVGNEILTISSTGTILASGTETYNNGTISYSSGYLFTISTTGVYSSRIRPPNVNSGENSFGSNAKKSKNKVAFNYYPSAGNNTVYIYNKSGSSAGAFTIPAYKSILAMNDSYVMIGDNSGGWSTTSTSFQIYSQGSGTLFRTITFNNVPIDQKALAYYMDDQYVYFTVRNRLEIIRLSDGVTIQRYTDPDGVPYVIGSNTFANGKQIIYAKVGSVIKAYINNA